MNEIRKGHVVVIIQDALLIDALANTLDDILNTLSAFVLLLIRSALSTPLFRFYLMFDEPSTVFLI